MTKPHHWRQLSGAVVKSHAPRHALWSWTVLPACFWTVQTSPASWCLSLSSRQLCPDRSPKAAHSKWLIAMIRQHSITNDVTIQTNVNAYTLYTSTKLKYFILWYKEIKKCKSHKSYLSANNLIWQRFSAAVLKAILMTIWWI